MPRKIPEQFPLDFEQAEPETEKVREVVTDSGTIKITEGPTRTVWEGLEPAEDPNPYQSDVRSVARPEPTKSKNITSEKRKKDWEEVKKARRAVGDKYRGPYKGGS